MEAFFAAVLAGMSIPATAHAVGLMLEWARFEGTYLAGFNPLNTMEDAPGATLWNPQGVKSYPDADTGAKATARTLIADPAYGPIIAALQSGYIDADTIAAFRYWGTGSKTGAYAFADHLAEGWRPPSSKPLTDAEKLLAGFGYYDADGKKLSGRAALDYALSCEWSVFLAIFQLQTRVADLEARLDGG